MKETTLYQTNARFGVSGLISGNLERDFKDNKDLNLIFNPEEGTTLNGWKASKETGADENQFEHTADVSLWSKDNYQLCTINEDEQAKEGGIYLACYSDNKAALEEFLKDMGHLFEKHDIEENITISEWR